MSEKNMYDYCQNLLIKAGINKEHITENDVEELMDLLTERIMTITMKYLDKDDQKKILNNEVDLEEFLSDIHKKIPNYSKVVSDTIDEFEKEYLENMK